MILYLYIYGVGTQINLPFVIQQNKYINMEFCFKILLLGCHGNVLGMKSKYA